MGDCACATGALSGCHAGQDCVAAGYLANQVPDASVFPRQATNRPAAAEGRASEPQKGAIARKALWCTFNNILEVLCGL